MSDEVIVYGNITCPMVAPVRGVLERAGVAFEYVDIGQDAEARQRVMAINQGNASVPTLVFADGSTLTEPSMGQLKRKLGQLGYADGRSPTLLEAAKENLMPVLVGVALAILGLADGGNWVLLTLGGLLVVGTVANGKLRG